MALPNWQEECSRDGHRMVFSGNPFAMHCHHYNVNLQKTMEDSLGNAGVQLLCGSAAQSGYQILKKVFRHYDQINTEKLKLEMAVKIFQDCGLGIIRFQRVSPEGGRIISLSSHQVTGWLAKHGKRDTPGCHFTRGWIAGVLDLIYDQPLGFYKVEERQCKMMREAECVFIASPAQP